MNKLIHQRQRHSNLEIIKETACFLLLVGTLSVGLAAEKKSPRQLRWMLRVPIYRVRYPLSLIRWRCWIGFM